MIQKNREEGSIRSDINGKEPIGEVLVCGGGVAGIQASIDLSAAGFRVHLVEHGPAVGGGMARLDKTFPTGDCATCIISPKLVECMRDHNIDTYTMADVVKLEGEAGSFKATVRQRQRYVDIDKCTACGDCAAVCPIELSSSFDAGMARRKAIDRLYAQAAPNAFFISKKERAPCSSACPVDTSVQAYVALIAAGRFKEAADVIRSENPLPGICGRVCFHPCEIECNRGAVDSPVSIRALKRFAIAQHPEPELPEDVPASSKSVAIIGSGPAGLSAAHQLALLGHKATVYEALPVLGGMLAVGIPDYRLPPAVLEQDLDAIRSLGVTFETNSTVGRDVSADRITNDFDAVFVATGAHNSRRLEIPGEDCEDVIHGVDFLRRRELGEAVELGRRVVIIGGGNTAIDAARTAVRLDVDEVTLVYRRTRQEMPAHPAEIDAAITEGIQIHYLAAPVRVVSEAGRLTAVECIRMELGEPDDSGRRRPVPIVGSEFVVAADTLIPAVSQFVDQKMAELFGLATTRWQTIDSDELTLATSREGFFAGGDVAIGPASVIDAIDHGKRAAAAIDNYLSERPLAQGLAKREKRRNPLSPQELEACKRRIERSARVEPESVPIDQRLADFREVEQVYTPEQARAEAARCLNCSDCCECMRCVEACQARAVIHDEQGRTLELEVGAVLLTPGFEAFDARRRGEFGFGFARNVVSNSPSSNASDRATRRAATTTAPASAVWPPPRKRSWPRNTSRSSRSPSSSWTSGRLGRTSTAIASAPRASACATSAPSSPEPTRCPVRTTFVWYMWARTSSRSRRSSTWWCSRSVSSPVRAFANKPSSSVSS
jgi:NADPH-dependent glutamate synthase beta subunit-like oxidoreductase